MENFKLVCDESIVPITIEDFDPIYFSEENVLLYNMFRDDYRSNGKLEKYESGIVNHNGNFYFFTHNHSLKPRVYDSYTDYSFHSYDLYQIRYEDVFNIIKNDGQYNYWELKFSSWFNFGDFYKSIKRYNYYTFIKIPVYVENNYVIIQKGINPSTYKESGTIGEFLEKHRSEYPISKFTKNTVSIRDYLIGSIL